GNESVRDPLRGPLHGSSPKMKTAFPTQEAIQSASHTEILTLPPPAPEIYKYTEQKALTAQSALASQIIFFQTTIKMLFYI
ncbi:hypothetical protein, partial [Denitromonas iodatirespirans]|uniref:hypothetical protein n=1 Tax=Denitromonas iodatirespirans TaxID=2795389 RepID=UPI001BDC1FB9